MAELSLRLFGVPRVQLEGVAVGIRRRKAIALLVYLAVTQQAHGRDALATLLWPEYGQDSARNSLRRTLSSLQRHLGRQWLDIDRAKVVMSNVDNVWVDVNLFRKLLDSVRSHHHADNATCQDCLSTLTEAVSLYENDWLQGFSLPDAPQFDEWQRLEGENLRTALGRCLERVAIGCAKLLEHETAVDYARRWIALDPLHEPAHRLLMRLYAETGQVAAAVRQFEECARVLKTELGVPVEEQTSSLLAAIRDSRLGTSGQISIRAAPWDIRESVEPEHNVVLPDYLQSEVKAREPALVVFVARYRELARLHQLLADAVDGDGGILFVAGEAGSGKTALVHEFARQAQANYPDLIVASGTCDVYTGIGDPYLPFRDILNMFTADVETRWRAGAITRDHALRLWRLLPQAVQALVDEGPVLIDTLIAGSALYGRATAHAPEEAKWIRRLKELSAGRNVQTPDRSRLFEGYLNLLITLSSRHPLLLFLDDLHWADTSSLGLLFHLSRRVCNHRILILAAYRWEEPDAAKPQGDISLSGMVGELCRRYGDIVIDMDDISEAQARQFVDALLDSSPNRLDEGFRQALLRQGRGHPLFTVELLRHLEECGSLTQDTQGRRLTSSNLGWDSIPKKVEGVIARRIERLDDTSVQILRLASVEGENFTAQIIAKVMGLEEQTVIRCLSNELQNRHHLVYAEGIHWVGTRRLYRYRFHHNLIQLYLYQCLDQVERAYLHEQVGTILEGLCADSEDELEVVSSHLARHFQEARDAKKAVHYRLVAGRRAIRLSANQEAFAHLQQGLAMLETLPDTPERAEQELAYQIAMGIPVTATRGYAHADAQSTYVRANALSKKVGATPELFPSLFGLWRFHLIHSGAPIARRLAARLMQIAQRSNESSLMVEAERATGVTCFHAGELIAARHHLEQGLELYNSQQHGDHAYIYGHDPGVSLLGYLAHSECLLGNPERGAAYVDELLTLARSLSHPLSLAHALSWGGAVFFQLAGQPRQALAIAEEGLALTEKHALPMFAAASTIIRGWALAALDQPHAGITTMRTGIASWLDTGAAAMSFYFYTLLAAAYGVTGDMVSGLQTVEQALTVAQETGNHFFEAESYRVLGELLVQQNQLKTAETHLQKALDVARQQEARLLELRAGSSLARLYQQQGQGPEGLSLLTHIVGKFDPTQEGRDLQIARKLAETLRREIRG